MSDIEIEIDGQLVKANQGDSIISIADREGIEVPRFCYHKKLSVAANCRMCLAVSYTHLTLPTKRIV